MMVSGRGGGGVASPYLCGILMSLCIDLFVKNVRFDEFDECIPIQFPNMNKQRLDPTLYVRHIRLLTSDHPTHYFAYAY